ncbi:MAG: hypothetical protein E6G94_04085 [Alphaproteobacteria bacterium]|nr:MAG: hypothetical protein E6G94_04085 [Alphaproteobacteria bacterium]
MSPFELVFALFGLLLGLAIAEVLGGFARALRLRRSAKAVRIGWLTPLLGLFVILDLTSFWVVAYEARDQLRANYLTLIVVSAIVGTYYLAASLIFPDDPGEWPDFDDHYDRQNRFVILGLLGANLGSAAGQIALEIVSPTPDAAMGSDAQIAVDGLTGLTVLALLIALIFVKGRKANAAILVLLVAILFGSSVVELMV